MALAWAMIEERRREIERSFSPGREVTSRGEAASVASARGLLAV